MDAKTFLDEFLKVGKDYAEKGKVIVKDKIEDQKSDKPNDNLKKMGIAAGAMLLLLGTKGGRSLTGSAVRLGGLAAVGGTAYTAWQNMKQMKQVEQAANKAELTELLSIDKLDGDAADDRAMTLIKAMLAAAKADGNVDDGERDLINAQIRELGVGKDLEEVLEAGSVTPLSAKAVARMADNSEIAAEIYLVSQMITNSEDPREAQYMEELAAALELPEAMLAELKSA